MSNESTKLILLTGLHILLIVLVVGGHFIFGDHFLLTPCMPDHVASFVSISIEIEQQAKRK